MLKNSNYGFNKNVITLFQIIKLFDFLPLMSQLDCINTKPKPLLVVLYIINVRVIVHSKLFLTCI